MFHFSKIIFFFIISLLLITCGKPSDQKAYEDVISTMSLEKAKNFFYTHPESPYADRLASDLVIMYSNEKSEVLCTELLKIIPEKYSQHKILTQLCIQNKQSVE